MVRVVDGDTIHIRVGDRVENVRYIGIKGNLTPYSGERCIYHPPGDAFYGRTKPERCYTTGEEAVRDGCGASKR